MPCIANSKGATVEEGGQSFPGSSKSPGKRGVEDGGPGRQVTVGLALQRAVKPSVDAAISDEVVTPSAGQASDAERKCGPLNRSGSYGRLRLLRLCRARVLCCLVEVQADTNTVAIGLGCRLTCGAEPAERLGVATLFPSEASSFVARAARARCSPASK